MFNFQSQKDRSRMYRAIRDFFDSRDYLEVFTPTLSPTLIPEPTIQNFETRFINEFVASRDFYLIPSPEIFMKEALAGGSGSIYQISQCFRNSEQLGSIHNPEISSLSCGLYITETSNHPLYGTALGVSPYPLQLPIQTAIILPLICSLLSFMCILCSFRSKATRIKEDKYDIKGIPQKRFVSFVIITILAPKPIYTAFRKYLLL